MTACITDKALLNEVAVSQLVGVSLATVRRWRLINQGPRFVKLGAAVRYRPEDIQRWLDSRPYGGEEVPSQELLEVAAQ